MPKVKLISECCEAEAILENEYADGSGVDYYICTFCHQPCELVGFMERES